MSTDDMHDLAARLARGDEAAFAELYDACGVRLHAYVAARLGSRDTASDVLQATFLRLVKSRKKLRGVENPIAYLFQIARNEALRYSNRRAPTGRSLNIAENSVALATNGQSSSDDREMVIQALARLGEEDREIIELKLYGELTFREIADVVDLPQATVATRYRRALDSLRPWLETQLR